MLPAGNVNAHETPTDRNGADLKNESSRAK